MSSVLKLGLVAILPVIAAVLFWFLETKTKFKKLPYMARQIIIGIVFGAIAIFGTEYGIPMNGAQVNCRDAAPLVAGLMFGGPAGIIAAVIGGVERYIAVAWGVGTFTRVACSVSTLVAGFYAAILRKYLFNDKRPTWWIALAAGVVMEVFHLSMVFITNMNEAVKAATVVRSCTLPLVIANSLSVMAAAIVLALLYHDVLFTGKKVKKSVTRVVQRHLFITVLIAYFISTIFIALVQTNISKSETADQLNLAISDTLSQIDEYASSIKEQEAILIAENRHIEDTGYIFIADEEGNILSTTDDNTVKTVKEFGIDDSDKEETLLETVVNGEETFYMYRHVQEHYIVAAVSKDEAYEGRDTMIYVNSFLEIIIFAILFLLIYVIINKAIIRNVFAVNEKLEKITDGQLDTVVDVNESAEFVVLSDGINATVTRLKELINEAEERIAAELQTAKDIQTSVLPVVDKDFLENKHFDIYAKMRTAKQVGGDFYDFYLSDDEKILYFLIADVSGKGIPAAMFMMRAKAQIKSCVENGLSIDRAFEESNKALCEGNEQGMFVTAWMGALNLETGHVDFVNAGHNPPLLFAKGNGYNYIEEKVNFILAGMDITKYKLQSFDLKKGDMIFLYTDGVTEATNKENVLFGEENLETSLNKCSEDTMQDICDHVLGDVDIFVGEAQQADDITMLSLRYNG